ncbi:MAG: glycosyltransferase family 4 protein [Candidatus Methanomethylicia archaeon]
MSKYRLGVFIDHTFYGRGGGYVAADYILKLLASTNEFEIFLYTGNTLNIKHKTIKEDVLPFLKARYKPDLFFNIITHKGCLEKILSSVDIVYIPVLSYPIIPIAKKLKKRVIVHLHGFDPISYTATILANEDEKFLKDLKKTVLIKYSDRGLVGILMNLPFTFLPILERSWIRQADAIICVSERHKELLAKYMPESKDKLHVVYNPPPKDIPVLRKFIKDPIFLYVGGSLYIKGFHILTRTLEIIGAKSLGKNLKFSLAGTYYAKHLAKLYLIKKRYNLNLEIVGWLNRYQITELYPYSYALLFPSIVEEPLPYSVLESMVSNTLPIASRVGGVPEIVNGTFAEKLLIKPMDENDLIEKIITVASMSNRSIIDKSSKLREHIIKKFNIEDIKSKLLQLYFYCLE